MLVHWNANFCPFVPRKPLSFLSLEALSHSLVLGGLHQLPLLAENLRRFYFSDCHCAQTSFLCFDRFFNLIFIFFPPCILRQGLDHQIMVSLSKLETQHGWSQGSQGFLPLTSILEEMEIEILAGEALQGLFDFPFKKNQVLN